MSARIVWVDHLVGLKEALVRFRGDVTYNLGCHDVVVRVFVRELHGFQIHFQYHGAMGCCSWEIHSLW